MGRRTVKRIQKKTSARDTAQKQLGNSASRAHPLMELQRSVGSNAVQRLIESPYIQTKLQVSTPEDQSEKEADKSAEAVMRSADGVHTTSAAANTGDQAGQVHESSSAASDHNLEKSLEGSGSSSPLPGSVRDFMEPRLGADLSGVKVHTGQEAAQLSRELQAVAFTHGENVYYGAGKSPGNDALTAHELSHVVQQTGHRGPAGGGLSRNIQQISRTPDQDQKKRDAKAVALSAELKTLIDGAIWKEIRKRVYPKESAAGVKRAKERKKGKLPDLTGVGKISTLEHFATAIKKVQADWGKLSPDDRSNAIGAAASAELVGAGVPGFLIVARKPMEWKGSFNSFFWKFNISEALVTSASLSNADAADLANTALHEARHAEQHFLAARYSAGPPDNKDQAAIAAEQNIPEDPIAKAAVAAKFEAKTDPTVAALGKNMYKAMVTDKAVNQNISDDDYTKEMKDARDEAIKSLAALKAAATDATINDAKAKRDTLKAAIAEVEKRYTLYRNIPYEADAHEVGDAAGEAFKGWP
jgi:hypothetical protein